MSTPRMASKRTVFVAFVIRATVFGESFFLLPASGELTKQQLSVTLKRMPVVHEGPY